MFTTTHLTTTTKAGRLAAADFATHAWSWHSEATCSSRCTFCGVKVQATRLVLSGGRAESPGSALVGAMLQHFEAGHQAVA